MPRLRDIVFASAFVALVAPGTPAAAVCIAVATPAALSNIRNNLAGDYCLTKNIDMATFGNFTPIGDFDHHFSGTLDGAGFAIQNLKINSTDVDNRIGFFSIIEGGTVRNIKFLNVSVTSASPFAVGAIAGQLWTPPGLDDPPTAHILKATVTGKVVSTGESASAGGIVGSCFGEIADSSFAGNVSGAAGVEGGGLVGTVLSPCKVVRSHAAGAVSATGRAAVIGGLAGYIVSGTVNASYATNTVTGTGALATDYVYVGGFAGKILNGAVTASFATGAVAAINAGSAGTSVAGFAGVTSGTLRLCFATGPVSGGSQGYAGGFAGYNYGDVFDAYATGPVTGSTASAGGPTGGMVGYLVNGGTLTRTFAVGKVVGAAGKTGGLVGKISSQGPVTQSYWDLNTTGQAQSFGLGAGRLTTGLRHALQAGLAAPSWSITPDVTYPIMTRTDMLFWSTLSTTVSAKLVYTFLPIAQLDRAEYVNAPAHANRASEAAVYTMLARAIGITKNVAALKTIRIDTSYWNDSAQTTSFNGPITSHASRGPATPIAAATPINAANILGKLKANKLVLISGAVPGGTHSMLATSYIVNGSGAVTALVAIDPYTGRQVRINPTTKKVVAPAGFPFASFTVTSYRVLTLL